MFPGQKIRFKKIEVSNGDNHTYGHDPEVCQRLGVSVWRQSQENGTQEKRRRSAVEKEVGREKEKISQEEITRQGQERGPKEEIRGRHPKKETREKNRGQENRPQNKKMRGGQPTG